VTCPRDNGTTAISTDIDIDAQPEVYLNDQQNMLAATEGIAITADGKTDLEIPARSLRPPAADGRSPVNPVT